MLIDMEEDLMITKIYINEMVELESESDRLRVRVLAHPPFLYSWQILLVIFLVARKNQQ